jgi:hypothetical protein
VWRQCPGLCALPLLASSLTFWSSLPDLFLPAVGGNWNYLELLRQASLSRVLTTSFCIYWDIPSLMCRAQLLYGKFPGHLGSFDVFPWPLDHQSPCHCVLVSCLFALWIGKTLDQVNMLSLYSAMPNTYYVLSKQLFNEKNNCFSSSWENLVYCPLPNHLSSILEVALRMTKRC